MRGRELVDAYVVTMVDFDEWMRVRRSGQETAIGLGLPSYTFLHFLLNSIKGGTTGLLLSDGVEVTHLNCPQDRRLDWFLHPMVVLKEQIKIIRLEEADVRYLEKITLFFRRSERMEAWNNGSIAPNDALRAAQIQAISRRNVKYHEPEYWKFGEEGQFCTSMQMKMCRLVLGLLDLKLNTSMNATCAVGHPQLAKKGEQFLDIPYAVKGMDVSSSEILSYIEATAVEKLKNNEYTPADLCYSRDLIM